MCVVARGKEIAKRLQGVRGSVEGVKGDVAHATRARAPDWGPLLDDSKFEDTIELRRTFRNDLTSSGTSSISSTTLLNSR